MGQALKIIKEVFFFIFSIILSFIIIVLSDHIHFSIVLPIPIILLFIMGILLAWLHPVTGWSGALGLFLGFILSCVYSDYSDIPDPSNPHWSWYTDPTIWAINLIIFLSPLLGSYAGLFFANKENRINQLKELSFVFLTLGVILIFLLSWMTADYNHYNTTHHYNTDIQNNEEITSNGFGFVFFFCFSCLFNFLFFVFGILGLLFYWKKKNKIPILATTTPKNI